MNILIVEIILIIILMIVPITMLDNASAWAPPSSLVGGIHRERGTHRVRSAHHAQINEPLQRPQVRHQCILNCRHVSAATKTRETPAAGDEKGAEEEFCGPLNL